jgi:hypothetical protein
MAKPAIGASYASSSPFHKEVARRNARNRSASRPIEQPSSHSPSDELPTMRRLGSWWRHVHAAGPQDRDAYTRHVRTRMTSLCPSAVPYAFARFLPPEPNIRTLKRGGGEKT